MERPILNEAPEKRISVLELGAKGDGKTDDFPALEAAVRFAAEKDLILEFPKGEYYLSDGLFLDDISMLSHDARILYHGEKFGTPAFRIVSNVNLFGTWYIYAAPSARKDAAERAPIAIGDYMTDRPSRNCYIQEVILSGGNPDSNGICITGDTRDVIIDSVIIPDGSAICRGVCLHWGNGVNHRNTAGRFAPELGRAAYSHGDTPMTHPRGIHLGVVNCAGFKAIPGQTDNDKAAVTICACADISVDEIMMHDSCHALCVTGADLGFEYADEETRAYGQRNIYVKKITGTAMRSAGVLVAGYPWYIREVRVNTEIRIDECYVEAAECNHDTGLALLGISKAEIGQITLRHFPRQAFNITRGSENISIDTLNIEGCKSYVGAVNMYSENDPPAKNIYIGELNVDGSGDANVPAFNLVAVENMTVEKLNIKDSSYQSLIAATDDCKNVHISRADLDTAQFENGLLAGVSDSVKNRISVDRLI